MMDAGTEGQVKFEIKNIQPIELLDLTLSLAAFGNEYGRHLDAEHPDASAADVKLYVNEIRTGSVIATLIAASPQIIQAGTYALSVVTFAEKLTKAYLFLTGKDKKPATLEKRSLENLSAIVEPIAKDSGSQLNIGTNLGAVYLTINSSEANHAQNSIRRLLNEEAATTTGYHKKVLLYWYQARGDAKSTTGDRGVIESISDAAVKVICINDRIKEQMILDVANPFREAYIVDVAVETIRGKPAVYKVMALHEKIPRED